MQNIYWLICYRNDERIKMIGTITFSDIRKIRKDLEMQGFIVKLEAEAI